MNDGEGESRGVSPRPRCPTCGGDRVVPRYQMNDYSIERCLDCTQMWLTPQPTEEMLRNVYSADYFSNDHFLSGRSDVLYGYHDYMLERFTRQSGYRAIVSRLKECIRTDARPHRLLDVGCGMGHFLDVAHDAGFSVRGVEFNPYAVAALRSKYVFPIECGDFMAYDGGPVDAISMLDVIEHMRNPIAVLERARDLLPAGGVLVLTTMDSDSVMSRLLGARLEDFRRVREHLFFFTRKSISVALESLGMEVLGIRSHGHTIELGFLADRLALVSRMAGRLLGVLVRALGVTHATVHINPGTKMILFARRR